MRARPRGSRRRTLAQFGPQRQARQRYRAFVAQGKASGYAPWEELIAQMYLGGEAFRKRVQRMVAGRTRSREVPRLQRLPARPGPPEIIAATSREFGEAEGDLRRRRHTPARLAVAYLARHEGALKLSEFAPALGVRDWAASHLATSAERLVRESRRFHQSLHASSAPWPHSQIRRSDPDSARHADCQPPTAKLPCTAPGKPLSPRTADS